MLVDKFLVSSIIKYKYLYLVRYEFFHHVYHYNVVYGFVKKKMLDRLLWSIIMVVTPAGGAILCI